MQPKSCSRCLDWTNSLEGVVAVLKRRWHPRESCAHQPLMSVVMEQFRTGRPHWWVVSGAIVVPMWVVERLHGRGNICSRAYSGPNASGSAIGFGQQRGT